MFLLSFKWCQLNYTSRSLILSLSPLSYQILCRQVQCLVAAPHSTCRRLSWTPLRIPPVPTYWSSPPLPLFKWPAPATPTLTLISTFSTPPLVSSHSSVFHSLNQILWSYLSQTSCLLKLKWNTCSRATTELYKSSLSANTNKDYLPFSVFTVKDCNSVVLLSVKCFECMVLNGKMLSYVFTSE